MRRFNWLALQNRYVLGDDKVTLKSLSLGPDAPTYKTIRKRASIEKWTRQRYEFRYSVVIKTRQIYAAMLDLNPDEPVSS